MTVAHNRWLFIGLKIFSAMGFFYPIWFLYEQQYLTLSQIAVLEGLIVGIQLILEIPTGAIADIFGTRMSIALGYLIQAISFIIFSWARSFPTFILYAFIIGLGESLKSGAEDALEYDSLKAIGKEEEFPKYKSWYTLAFQISLAISFMIGGYLGNLNYQLPIYLTAIAFFLATISVLLMVDPLHQKTKPNLHQYFVQLKQGWLELTDNVYVRHVTMLYVGVGTVSWVTNISLLNIYLGQIGYTASEIGIVQGLLRILNIILIIKLLKPLIKPYLTPNIYYFFALIFAIGYLPAYFISKWPSIVVVGFIMISTTARWVVLGSYLHRHINSHNRATALSTASMLISLGHMSIMLVSAPLLPVIGGTKTFISLLGIMGTVICLWLSKSNHQVVKEYLYANQKTHS